MYRCHLCASADLRLFSRPDAKGGPRLELALCHRCSLVQQSTLPGQAELHEYYSRSYRQDYKGAVEPTPYRVYRAGRVALERLGRMLTHLQPQHQSLCDVGAGGGEMVYLAQQAGLAARGLEPHQGYSEFARAQYGVAVDTGGIDRLTTACTDVVTLFHVLEHLPDPLQAMAQIHRALKPGGLLVVEVPNLLQWDASPSNIYFGAHLYYFNRHTLLALTSAHFETVTICDDGNLWAVLRRRDQATRMEWPDAHGVEEAIARFDQKGWWSYLTKGQGWRKPWRRLQQRQQEKTARDLSPRDILNRIGMGRV
jgi:2-polyprenyl-3-methyl-5-hydroxy-6-metoxy-1,4-benzoquinol methylase